jgi:hypothetical protein
MAIILAGCEEMVDPVLKTEQSFTLFGFIDPGAARQAIRVFEISELLEETSAAPLDAEVILTAPGGEAISFADSVVNYSDGSIGHVYHAAFQPDFQSNYLLTVSGPDGRDATVNVRTPARATLRLEPAAGVRGNIRMPVVFEGAEQILAPRVTYTFESDRPPFSWTVPVVYGEDVVRTGDDWAIVVDLSRDIGVLYTVSGLRPGSDPIILNEMIIEAFVATRDWSPPQGAFDPEVLVQPGTFSNVENGFGFVGAGYTEEARTLPAIEILRLAGFANLPGS